MTAARIAPPNKSRKPRHNLRQPNRRMPNRHTMASGIQTIGQNAGTTAADAVGTNRKAVPKPPAQSRPQLINSRLPTLVVVALEFAGFVEFQIKAAGEFHVVARPVTFDTYYALTFMIFLNVVGHSLGNNSRGD